MGQTRPSHHQYRHEPTPTTVSIRNFHINQALITQQERISGRRGGGELGLYINALSLPINLMGYRETEKVKRIKNN